MDSGHFYLNEYELTLYNKAFLVSVVRLEDPSPHQDKATDLPNWAFHSGHAIWLVEGGGASQYARANEGEKVKARLMSTLLPQDSVFRATSQSV